MRNYDSKHILNIALAGHKGSGKLKKETLLWIMTQKKLRENLLFLLLLLRLNGKIQRLILSIHPDYLILPVVSQKV